MRRTLRISGRCAALAAVVALAISARTASGAVAHRQIGGVLDRPARLDIRGVSLVKALRELADHARVALVYSPSLVPEIMVSCPCAAATTREALETLLAATTLTFREAGGQVMLVPAPLQRLEASLTPTDDTSSPQITLASPDVAPVTLRASSVADSAIIVGRVTSDAGAPVFSAVVSIRDLRLSTTTNDAGVFRIVVPPDRFSVKSDTATAPLWWRSSWCRAKSTSTSSCRRPPWRSARSWSREPPATRNDRHRRPWSPASTPSTSWPRRRCST
jgi:hypothetical protein